MNPSKIIVIAECGVNHNGSLERAKEMVDIAADAGADFVKFQVFNTELLVKKEAPLASYQQKNVPHSNSQFNLLKQYEFSFENFQEIFDYCATKQVSFLATPFDHESLRFLNQLGVEDIKVSSGDLTNGPLLLEIARLDKKVILSTGMANLDEIFSALAVLQYGYADNKFRQTPLCFNNIISLAQKRDFSSLRNKVSVLHCTSSYPAEPKSLNLKAIQTLKEKTELNVGYSDHSEGIHISIAAAAIGAQIIEKHFTISRSLPGPDHKASIEPCELKEMISNIRDIELALGNGEKKPDLCELDTALIVRKGLYAKRRILKGDVISDDSISILRPEAKTSPMLFWDKLSSVAENNYQVGDPL